MGGVLFQYGTAAHLAILTVAPLFLFALCGQMAHAEFLGWLSLLAAMWIVMNPSPREGEWPRDARHRIGFEIARDPFLIFGIVALLLAAVRAINGGIGLVYNSDSGLWSLKGPAASVLPGSVSSAGVLPLAGIFAMMVVALGVRHALGARARRSYLLFSGILAAIAVSLWKVLSANGFALPSELGSLLGVYFLFSVFAWVGCWTSGSHVLEFVAAIVSSILLFGLLTSAPAISIWVFVLSGVAIVAVGIGLSLFQRSVSAWLRTALALVIVFAPLSLLLFGEIPITVVWPIFPDGFVALREVASSVALAAWRESAQLGVGLGAYPLSVGFFAKPEDWAVLTPTLVAVPNGWIHFLFERGLLGATVLLCGFGLLLRDAIMRFVRAGTHWFWSVDHLIGPIVFVAAGTVTFFDCTYIQPVALMSICAAWGLTAAAFPESSED